MSEDENVPEGNFSNQIPISKLEETNIEQQQTQNMEVDHQTDLQHTRKKFKEYFFVFCFDIRSFGYPLTLAIK